ncbi:MAG: hypothetical protein GX677_11055 [Treponema sp.]|nr:hypothetical protein [Treponema sp.]
MIREKSCIVKTVEELAQIADELNIIDFLRSYFQYEYEEIFKKELDEKIAESKDYYYKEDSWDIRKYTLFVLKYFMEKRYNINLYYVNLENIKLVIFYENIITTLIEDDPKAIEINKRIYEIRKIYLLFRSLISNSNINIQMHKTALELIGMRTLTQEKVDQDENGFYKDFLSRNIASNILNPFFAEYIELLRKDI